MLLVVWGINYAGTRVYGEMEFWFCSLKVITIVGLIILGIILSAGGGPSHEVIGFKYWAETGGFMQLEGIPGAKGRFLGFFSTLINAAFAFVGTEMTSIGAAETSNPRKAVPNAIRGVWIRLLLFYICSAFVIGILVSPSDPSLNLSSTAAKSPFVIAINQYVLPVHYPSSLGNLLGSCDTITSPLLHNQPTNSNVTAPGYRSYHRSSTQCSYHPLGLPPWQICSSALARCTAFTAEALRQASLERFDLMAFRGFASSSAQYLPCSRLWPAQEARQELSSATSPT